LYAVPDVSGSVHFTPDSKGPSSFSTCILTGLPPRPHDCDKIPGGGGRASLREGEDRRGGSGPAVTSSGVPPADMEMEHWSPYVDHAPHTQRLGDVDGPPRGTAEAESWTEPTFRRILSVFSVFYFIFTTRSYLLTSVPAKKGTMPPVASAKNGKTSPSKRNEGTSTNLSRIDILRSPSH